MVPRDSAAKTRIGIVYNPNAGNKSFQRQALSILSQKLKKAEIHCTQATYRYIKDYFPNIKLRPSGEMTDTYLDSVYAGQALTDLDFIIALGGDGTVADLITGQKKEGILIPVSCIGCGTVNAGPFILTRSIDELRPVVFKKLRIHPITGIEARNQEGQFIGTAFNDLVFSDTIVSTVKGKVTTIDARKFLLGTRVEKLPGLISGDHTSLKINSREVVIPFKIAQIFLSPVHNSAAYSFKAITGKLCWMAFGNKRGALAVSSSPIVQIPTPKDFIAEQGMLLYQFIFDLQDSIEISGTKGFAIIDGNPRLDLEQENTLCSLSLNEEAAFALLPRDS
jgi:hypothetical protein